MSATKVTPTLKIRGLPETTVSVPIVGTSPLIMHKFSEKAKRIIAENQAGVKRPKGPRDPEGEYLAAIHRLADGRPGFPATGFKACTVSAGRHFGKIMTQLRQAMFFHGEQSDDGLELLFAIEGEHEMREDIVTIGRGSTDLRYRPMFRQWSSTLKVTIMDSVLDTESLLALVDAGGLTVGAGEWRAEKGGNFGSFKVDTSRDVEHLT